MGAPPGPLANRNPKSTEIRPKIAFLQKFRLRNFGRGVSGAAENFFLNYIYKLLSPKKFSWSSDLQKIFLRKSRGRGGTGNFMSDLADIFAACKDDLIPVCDGTQNILCPTAEVALILNEINF